MDGWAKKRAISVSLMVLTLGSAYVGVVRAGQVATTLVISEFMASNERSLRDQYRDYSDWIEIQNLSAETVNLDGWALTDDPNDLDK